MHDDECLFLYHSVFQKQKARFRGFTKFSCVHENFIFLTGLHLIRYVLDQLDAKSINGIGFDLDDEYLKASFLSAKSLGTGMTSWEDYIPALHYACETLKNEARLNGTGLYFNSEHFIKFFKPRTAPTLTEIGGIH